jgi:hypothetical protein
MLALTTYPGPRNVWIDLAFFGLSTMTSERPAAPPPSSLDAVRRRVEATLVLASVVEADAARFRVFASGDEAPVLDDLADFRATVSSYLLPPPHLDVANPVG